VVNYNASVFRWRVSVGINFLGGLNIHLSYFPALIPQKPQILGLFSDFKNYNWKCLTMEMLIYKLLLIVIVTLPKWHSE